MFNEVDRHERQQCVFGRLDVVVLQTQRTAQGQNKLDYILTTAREEREQEQEQEKERLRS